jgi:hypothetical protein
VALRKRLMAAKDEAGGPDRDVLLAFRRIHIAVRRADQCLLPLARKQDGARGAGAGSDPAGPPDPAHAVGGERPLRHLISESAARARPPAAAGDPVRTELEMVAAKHLRDRALMLQRLAPAPPASGGPGGGRQPWPWE